MYIIRGLLLFAFIFFACWFVGNGVIMTTCGFAERWWGEEGYYAQPVCRPVAELAEELTAAASGHGQ